MNRNDAPISVNFDDFRAFVDEEQRFDSRIREEIANADVEWLGISYEELVESRDVTLDKVFAFLDLDSPAALDGKLAKLSSGSAASRISNYAELSKLAAGTTYEQYLR